MAVMEQNKWSTKRGRAFLTLLEYLYFNGKECLDRIKESLLRQLATSKNLSCYKVTKFQEAEEKTNSNKQKIHPPEAEEKVVTS